MASLDTPAARLEALLDVISEIEPLSPIAPTPSCAAPPQFPPRYPSPSFSEMEPLSPIASIPGYAAPLSPHYHNL